MQVLRKDGEIKRLIEDTSKQAEKYQNLQQTKTALDMEIAVYKRLLESEEDRLGIQTGDFFIGINKKYCYFRSRIIQPSRCLPNLWE